MLRRQHLALLPIAAGLVVHSRFFGFVNDDAYISFVYSRNLAEHGQLVFNLGDRVEGYTNFLWTVLIALFMKLGITPEVSSQVLGALFGIGGLVLVSKLSARLAGERSFWDLLPAVLLAASSGYACWCSGGLETQMFTFFVLLGITLALFESFAYAGVTFALAAMTRPEGLLVLTVVSAFFAMTKRRRLRREFIALGTFAALYAPYFAWRWWYYGWPFPNTFYVKTGAPPSPHFAKEVLGYGTYYVWQWATQSKAIYAAPLALLALFHRRDFAVLALLLAVAYLGYAIKVGGDFMGLHRFLMPLFPLTALLAALGLRWLAKRLPRNAGLAAAIVLCAAFTFSQISLSRAAMVPVADHGVDRPGYLKLYAHDRGLIGKALAPFIKPDDFAIVGGAGVQPYFARLSAIDVFGLVSERVAHEVPPSNPRPGHSKWAPAPLLLEHDPTFLFHCYDLHRDPNAYQLCGEAGFFQAHGYEPVTMHVPGLQERGEYYTFLKRKDRAWP